MNQQIPAYKDSIPKISTDQMIEVDRLMIEHYGIELIQMMENAGRCLALLAKQRFLNQNTAGKIVVLAGTGGNGGGALVCARRLATWGFDISVFVTNSDRMTPIPGHQLHILKKMGIAIHNTNQLHAVAEIDLIIDGIIGYSLQGEPHGPAEAMIDFANQMEIPVLSLDTPSGIDLTSGRVFSKAIRAQATLTLALPKIGLYQNQVLPYRGELYLGDISVPPELYSQNTLNLEVGPLFKDGDILRID